MTLPRLVSDRNAIPARDAAKRSVGRDAEQGPGERGHRMSLRTRSLLRLAFLALPFQMRQRAAPPPTRNLTPIRGKHRKCYIAVVLGGFRAG